MGISISCDPEKDWNNNRLTIAEVSDTILVSIHPDDESGTTEETTVSIKRDEFIRFCRVVVAMDESAGET